MESLHKEFKFFYQTESTKRFLGEFFSYLNSKKGFFLLIGEKGAGKSTLIERLKRVLPERYLAIHLDGDIKTPKEAFERILEALNPEINLNGSMGSKETFSSLIRQLFERKKEALILVDDAERLRESVIFFLIKLSTLEGPVLKVFHLILTGERSLIKKLSEKRFRGLIPSHIHFLSPMKFKEFGPYINQMLNLMQRLDLKVRQVDLPLLYSITSGNFGKIMEAVGKALSLVEKNRWEILDKRSFSVASEVEPGQKTDLLRLFLTFLMTLAFLIFVPPEFEREIYLKVFELIEYLKGCVP